MIDAVHGIKASDSLIKARTIREGCSSLKDADDDEDESIDTDAIVAYALCLTIVTSLLPVEITSCVTMIYLDPSRIFKFH